MADHYNFCFPIHTLANDRLSLEPFIPEHVSRFVEAVAPHPELFQYLSYGPFTENDSIISLVEKVDDNPAALLFAVMVKTDEHTTELAGTVGLIYSSAENSMTEIGMITIIPKYQRTFVATNAVGLLLKYTLDDPSDGGIGLRRVQWQAHASNAASVRLAKRMGFTMEGISRWVRVLPVGKLGNAVDVGQLKGRWGGDEQGPGRHSAVLSMCWDDWLLEGKRELVTKLMERRE